MMTIQDFVNQNEDQKIVINYRDNPFDEYDPLHHTLFEGRLHDVPENLRDLHVTETGWMIGAQCHCLTVATGEGKKIKDRERGSIT